MAHLSVRYQIVGTDQISRIDLAAVDELVDLDGSRRFQRDVLELLLRHLDEGVGVDLVALDDVLVGDLLAGVGVHLGVLDTVAGLPVELVEGDLFGFRRGRIERYRTGDEGKTQEAFPVSAGGHRRGTPLLMPDSRRTARLGSDIATFPIGGFFRGAASIGLDRSTGCKRGGSRSQWHHITATLNPFAEPRPLVRQPPPLLKHISAPVSSLDLIADRMRQRHLGHLARKRSALGGPIAKCAADAVCCQVAASHAAQRHQQRHVGQGRFMARGVTQVTDVTQFRRNTLTQIGCRNFLKEASLLSHCHNSPPKTV